MINIKHIKGTILLGAVLSIGLSSCQFANKYKSPVVETAELFRDETSTDTTTIASLSWKEYFQDPLLQALIHEGLEHNFDMRVATERIKQAEAQLSMAKAAYFPDFALVGGADHSRYSMQNGVRDNLGYSTTKYSLGVAASWELDVWGKINRQHRGKRAQYWSSLEAKNLVQTSLISNISTMYYSLMALDEQLRVTKEMVEILQESTKTMQAMMDAGLMNAAAVEQSKALLYSTEVSIPDLEYSIRELENSMSTLLGRQPGLIMRNKLEAQAVPLQLAFGVPAQMLAKRPDVKMAEFNFRAAFEFTNVAQASFYPSISLSSGMIGWGANSLSQFFKPQNLIANLVGNITQPLFAKGQLMGNLKIAKAEQEIALVNFEQAVVGAGAEVSNVLYQYERSLSKNKTRDMQVKSLSTALHFTEELLKHGEIQSYVEVLNAQQSLLQGQLGQVGDKLEQLQCSVNLYRSLGGGVE